MIQITKVNTPTNKYSIKCPFGMTPEGICIHNTANDASAMAEVSYMLGNNRECSFHFAVDNERAVQGLPLNRNGWHAGDGNGRGNRKNIAVEICYSKSGGDRYEAAFNNAVELVAMLLKQYGWGVDCIHKHQDFSGKYCPHRILDTGTWNKFIELVKSKLWEQQIVSNPVVAPKETPIPDVIYQVYTNQWLSSITNYDENAKNGNGYAGIERRPISGVKAKLSSGSISVRVSAGGRYFAWVKDNDPKCDGYAGVLGKPITRIQMKLNDMPGFAVEYRVSLVGSSGYLPWVRNYNNVNDDGYAGYGNKAIDKIQIRIVRV